MGRNCFVPGCKTGYLSQLKKIKRTGSKAPSLFVVPKDLTLFERWKNAIPGGERLSFKSFICEKHFKQEDIQRFFETKMPDGTIFRIKRAYNCLTPGSIPCFFPDVPVVKNSKKLNEKSKETKEISTSSPIKQEKSRKKIHSSEGKREKRRREGMKPKLKKNSSIQLGKENILFEGIIFEPIPQEQPTAEPVLLNEGSDTETAMECTLSNLQTDLTSQSIVSLFKERNDTNNELNSSTSELNQSLFKERNDTNNELDSTPTPFQNSVIIKTEPLFFDPPVVEDDPTKEDSIPIVCENILSESNVVLPKSVVEEQFSFNFLKININMVDIINSWWKVNVLDDFICFIRWTPAYTIERKIVITKDLAVKVFLYDVESTIGKDLEVISIDVISKLIFRVERTKICPRITERDGNCAGFLQGVFMCKKYNLCLNCIKWEKEQKKMLMRPVKLPNNLVELIRFNFNE